MEKIKTFLESKTFRVIEFMLNIGFFIWVGFRFYEKPEEIFVNLGFLLIGIIAFIINVKKKKIQNWLENKIKVAIINKKI